MATASARGERRKAVRRVLAGVLFLNLAVAAAKLAVGAATGTLSMLADGFHSLTDSAANVVGLVGLAVAGRPPDDDHPYGHRKFETLAALSIGALLAVSALEILQGLWRRLSEGGAPEVTLTAVVVMLVTIAVNLAVTTYEQRRARRLDSELLRADAAHTKSDVLTSLAVLASLGAARLGFPQLDAAAALMISGFIAWAAFKIVRDNSSLLADTAYVDAAELEAVALAVPGVESVHKVRSRGRPESGHADLHIQVSPELRIDEAHVIGHLVTAALTEELGFRDVLVHVEPPVGHHTRWRPDEEPPRR